MRRRLHIDYQLKPHLYHKGSKMKNVLELFNGKKRAIGGAGYVLIDILIQTGNLDPSIGDQIKILFGLIFGAGVGHAIKKAVK